MPSSLILVALVVAWLVVLVPMAARHRQQVRRVGGPALRTRVLHRGGTDRIAVHRGPATGHPNDPDWQEDDVADELADDAQYEVELDGSYDELDDGYDSDEADDAGYREREFVPQRRGRGGFDPEADAVAKHARYAIRQRVVLGLFAAAVVTAILAVAVSSALWGLQLVIDLTAVAYLAYLRRQTRIEAEVRQRRLQRIGRARLGVSSTAAESDDELPPRLHRPGAVVVEIDDEDPSFDHLETDGYDDYQDLRRASGE